jgi:hypothetical protein
MLFYWVENLLIVCEGKIALEVFFLYSSSTLADFPDVAT